MATILANYKISNVPEPATLALMALGAVGLAATRKRRKLIDLDKRDYKISQVGYLFVIYYSFNFTLV